MALPHAAAGPLPGVAELDEQDPPAAAPAAAAAAVPGAPPPHAPAAVEGSQAGPSRRRTRQQAAAAPFEAHVALPAAKRTKKGAVQAAQVPAAAPLDTDIPVLGHEPFLQLALGGLPNIMSAFQGGLLGSAPGVPDAVGSALLPATGSQTSSTFHVGEDSLWFVPLKPLRSFLESGSLSMCRRAWGGLQPGDSCGVTMVVLVPSGPQQQQQQRDHPQQQQQEEEEEGGAPLTGCDMPGDWHVYTQGDGTLSVFSHPETSLGANDVAQQLTFLEKYFVLRVHFAQGQVRLYCVPPCFLWSPPPAGVGQPQAAAGGNGSAPLRSIAPLEQRLLPQLLALAAGSPLQRPLFCNPPLGRQGLIQGPAMYWYPCALLSNRATGNSLPVSGAVWDAVTGKRYPHVVTVQLLGPYLPGALQQQPEQQQQQQQPQHSSSMDWVLLQQEAGMHYKVRTAGKTPVVTGSDAWRRMLSSPWGSWYLFKAQALYVLPPKAFGLPDNDSIPGAAPGAAAGVRAAAAADAVGGGPPAAAAPAPGSAGGSAVAAAGGAGAHWPGGPPAQFAAAGPNSRSSSSRSDAGQVDAAAPATGAGGAYAAAGAAGPSNAAGMRGRTAGAVGTAVMAAAPAMGLGTGPPARLPAPLPPAAAPAFRGAAALPPQLPAAAAPGAEGGAGAAAALAELLPDTADWETQQLGVTNLMIELQFPLAAIAALEQRWGFEEEEPLPAAQQQRFVRHYRMLRHLCLHGTRDHVLARLHTMAGSV